MKGHDIRGWLPKDWVDSLSWAPISATYTQLTDTLAKAVNAVRIKVTKRHGFHLLMTTKESARENEGGATHIVSGWVRSPLGTGICVGFRQDDAPRDYYEGKDLSVDGE